MLADSYLSHLRIFAGIEFVAEDHSYLINKQVARSVTTILKQFIKPFDSDYWAELKARELGITPDELKAKWEFNSKLAKVKGTVTHNILESKLSGREFFYPEELILNHFGYDPIQDLIQHLLPQLDKFVGDIEGKMHPIASELVIGDSGYMVGGTVDQIFYNHKSSKLEIWDWKTNKQIKTTSRFFHLAPLEHVPDTELDHYSLQLSFYKFILEKNTSMEFGESYIVWFHENNANYQIYRAKDYRSEIEQILR